MKFKKNKGEQDKLNNLSVFKILSRQEKLTAEIFSWRFSEEVKIFEL